MSAFSCIEIDKECYYLGFVCQDGIPDGLGVFMFSDRKSHIGFYSKGILEGFGIIDFENGDKYRGTIKNEKFNGLGYMYSNK